MGKGIERLMSGIVGGLFCGFILSLFGFYDMLLDALSKTNYADISQSQYYLTFVVLGIIFELIEYMFDRNIPD